MGVLAYPDGAAGTGPMRNLDRQTQATEKSTQTNSATPRIIGLDDDDADEVFSALSSSTSRTILRRLDERPSSASDLKSELEMSIQNVHYHLEKLHVAGLITQVDTRYSQKGLEMNVYAATEQPLVLMYGTAAEQTRLRQVLKQGVSVLSLLVILSGIVQFGVQILHDRQTIPRGTGGPYVSPEMADPSIRIIPPGLLFFAGGILVLGMVGFWWYRIRSRSLLTGSRIH